MIIAVTGATGRLGRAKVAGLRAAGHLALTRRSVRPVAVTALALVLSGCSATAPEVAPATGPATGPALFPADGVVDDQLGGAYDPVADVTIVARDSTERMPRPASSP